MARSASVIVLVAASLLIHTGSEAGTVFSEMVVFGDSLSDTGNVYELTGGLIPASPPYYEGRFCNGPIWAEYLAGELEISPLDFDNRAFGGSGASNVLQAQVGSYVGGEAISAGALHVLWAGANDVLGAPGTAITAAGTVAEAVETLIDAGAEHILVPNLPDLSIVPRMLTQPQSAIDEVQAATLAFNTALEGNLAGLDMLTDANIIRVDAYATMQDILADPVAYGFVNTTDQGINAPFEDQSGYLFWDTIHPTTGGHEILAHRAYAAIPEPTSLFLLAIGLATVGQRVRNRGAA